MNNRTTFPHLDQLFGGWFHQDWRCEAGTYEGIVKNFIQQNPREIVVATREELRAFLDIPHSRTASMCVGCFALTALRMFCVGCVTQAFSLGYGMTGLQPEPAILCQLRVMRRGERADFPQGAKCWLRNWEANRRN